MQQPFRAEIARHGQERLATIRTQPGVTEYTEKDGWAYWKGPESEGDRYKAILAGPAPSPPVGGVHPSYAPQPFQQPVPQQPFPSYCPQPVVLQPTPEPTGSWKWQAGLTAGASGGAYVGFEIADKLGTAMLATTSSSFNPDPNWYLVNAPIAGGVVGGIILGIFGFAIGMSAYNDERQRQGLRRIGPF